MKARYRLIRRGIRGGGFYCVDTETGKRVSLHTSSEDAARQIIEAQNQAVRQPAINMQIAHAYLQHGDPTLAKRTWQDVIDAMAPLKTGPTATTIAFAINGWSRWTRDIPPMED
jgi:hypothetical protein